MANADAREPSSRRPGAADALATELRRLRRERGLSMRDMAGPLHLSAHSAIADFESGHRLPANDILSAYERHFGLAAGSLRELRRRALAERAAAEAARVAGARTGRGGAPAQLPHDSGAFVGRQAQLRRLRDAVRRSRRDAVAPIVTICAIDGAAGVGKTALAVRFARRVVDRYPDGQLYVDLRGYFPHAAPLSSVQALGQLLRALGVDTAELPPDVDELAWRFRTALTDRRVLIMLDNAADTGQVRPLLPGHSGCLTVLTSRSSLSGLVARDGAHRTMLGVLSPEESMSLLAEVVGAARVSAEPGAAGRIVTVCGGLPLALRIAAERATLRAEVPLVALADELSDEHTLLSRLAVDDDETTGVRAAFSWSYRALPEPAARLFRCLAAHPGDRFTAPAAAATAGVPVADAEALIGTLVTAHLVETVDDAFFRMHDLLRVYALERLGADESPAAARAATARMAGWYLHTAQAAARQVRPTRRHAQLGAAPDRIAPLLFATYDDALAWLDAEHRNCTAAAVAAARVGLHEVAAAFPGVLYDVFELRGLVEEWEAAIQTALVSADRVGATATRATLLSNLAIVRRRSGREEAALPLLHESLELRRRVGDIQGEGRRWRTSRTSRGSTAASTKPSRFTGSQPPCTNRSATRWARRCRWRASG